MTPNGGIQRRDTTAQNVKPVEILNGVPKILIKQKLLTVDELRISSMDFLSVLGPTMANVSLKNVLWQHLYCFVAVRSDCSLH